MTFHSIARLGLALFIGIAVGSCSQQTNKKQDSSEKNGKKDQAAEIKASTRIKKGEKVPEFSFTTLSGQQYSIDDLKGKVVLINLFATWCPTCQKEMPALENKIWKQYREREDFFMISIGREQNRQKLKDFKDKKGYTFHFAADTARQIYGKFAGKYIPRNIIVDRQGTIVYQATGFDEAKLQEMLQQLGQTL